MNVSRLNSRSAALAPSCHCSDELLKLSPSLYGTDVDLTCYETFYDGSNIDGVFLSDEECRPFAAEDANNVESSSWLSDVTEFNLCRVAGGACVWKSGDFSVWSLSEGEEDVKVTEQRQRASVEEVEQLGISDLFQTYHVDSSGVRNDDGGGVTSDTTADQTRLLFSTESFDRAIAQQVPDLFTAASSSTSDESNHLSGSDGVESDAAHSEASVGCDDDRAGSNSSWNIDEEDASSSVLLGRVSDVRPTMSVQHDSLRDESSSDSEFSAESARRVPQSCVMTEHITYGHFIEE